MKFLDILPFTGPHDSVIPEQEYDSDGKPRKMTDAELNDNPKFLTIKELGDPESLISQIMFNRNIEAAQKVLSGLNFVIDELHERKGDYYKGEPLIRIKPIYKPLQENEPNDILNHAQPYKDNTIRCSLGWYEKYFNKIYYDQ